MRKEHAYTFAAILHLIDRVSFGLVLCNDEGEELLDVPVERRCEIRVHIDIEEQPIRTLSLSEGSEFTHTELFNIRES